MFGRKGFLILSMALVLGGCGTGKSIESDTENVTQENTVNDDKKQVKESKEASAEESSIEELHKDNPYDLFITGKIPANYTVDGFEPFYITDLTMDEEDYFSYSLGDWIDLDNDGEAELILDGPYGGMYLDARDDQVYVLAYGDGTAATLGYTIFDGQTWIVHSDVTHAGREIYDFTLYDGRGCVADAFRLSREYWDTPNEPDGPNTVYTYREEEITKEAYEEVLEKVFGRGDL